MWTRIAAEYGSPRKVGDYLLVGTETGILYGNERSGDITGFKTVKNTEGKDFRRMLNLGDRVYCMYDIRHPLIGYVSLQQGEPVFKLTSYSDEYSMERGSDGIMTSDRRWVRYYDRNGKITDYRMPEILKSNAP